MAVAYIALGSNLQNPARQVTLAFEAIAQLPGTALLKQSSLYKTAPVGYDNQPDFINAVAKVETALAPEAMMKQLLSIEQQFGRERPFPNAPRVLDLDLLLYTPIKPNRIHRINATICNLPPLVGGLDNLFDFSLFLDSILELELFSA